MTMRPRPWWMVLGVVGASWAVGCEPKVTVAEDGDAGSDVQEEGGTGATDPVGGAGGKSGNGVGGDLVAAGKAGSNGSGGWGGLAAGNGGIAGVAGFDYGGTSGNTGAQIEPRPATEEENSLPESCEFSFAPPSQGGTGGQTPIGGTGGQAAAGADSPGGEGGVAATETAGSSGTAGASSDPPVCACTRRPGDGNSFLCPWGEAVTASTQIGPDGGSLMLYGTESTFGVPVELRIPRGALEETVTISITETSIAPPDNLNDWSPLYRLEPADLTFLRPVELRIPWSGLSGFVPPNLAIYFSSEPGGSCDMAPLSDNYINAGFSQGSLHHLGWAIVGVPQTEGCP